MSVREHWRVIALVVLLVVSGVAVFGPVVANSQGPTNLQYGLELSGGTRITAPVNGVTATGVNVTPENDVELEGAVASELGVDLVDVQARPRGADAGVLEVYAPNVTTTQLRGALENAGMNPETVREGVTATTRETMVNVLSDKVNAVGLSGGSVSQARATTGQAYIVVEVPDQNQSGVRELVSDRGLVQLVAAFPGENDSRRTQVVVRGEDIQGIEPPTRQRGVPSVPITLTQAGAERFSALMQRYGFTSPTGVQNCNWPNPANGSYCLLTQLDQETIYGNSLGRGLAQDMESGAFNSSRQFVIQTRNMSAAREVQVSLQTGALPATLDLENATTSFVTAARASEFKTTTFLTGLAAVLAVSVVVFLRYGRPKVAAPMVLTALSEVAILLGFAAAIRLPLDLSHIAGFIAVIGTGVDDLVIIADEVLTQEVSSRRVFKSRFRKALWVIGAAAATTIIAMSPLTVLSLGDLQGFAIITILGVLIGVILTRPAYGDFLRTILTGR